MNQEQLQQFCALAGDRRGLDKPIRRNGYIYATNSHIVVRIADHPDIECSSEHAPLPTLESTVDQVISLPNYRPPQIQPPEPESCPACDGHGKVNTCDICNGEGEFKHGSNHYECRECDRAGYVSAANGKLVCTHCDGSGHDPYQRVVIEGNVGFARRYLTLLLTLPGIEFAINDTGPIAGFRFDGGVGALAPLRGEQ